MEYAREYVKTKFDENITNIRFLLKQPTFASQTKISWVFSHQQKKTE